jgi:hypothetical protein
MTARLAPFIGGCSWLDVLPDDTPPLERDRLAQADQLLQEALNLFS